LILESRRDARRRKLGTIFVLCRESTAIVLIDVDHGVVFIAFDHVSGP
jgi:hypothetical protein